MEELLKRPNRLHYEVMQRSHEAQPVSLGTDGWPTEDILDATLLLIVNRAALGNLSGPESPVVGNFTR